MVPFAAGAALRRPAQIGSSAETRQQRAPRRVGQRGKSAIERLVAILNHIVKYKPAITTVKRLGVWALAHEE